MTYTKSTVHSVRFIADTSNDKREIVINFRIEKQSVMVGFSVDSNDYEEFEIANTNIESFLEMLQAVNNELFPPKTKPKPTPPLSSERHKPLNYDDFCDCE